ncbi:inorganic diphosphatase [Pseudomonas sp. abacavir_1]
MSFTDLPAGLGIPDDLYAVIEIPANHAPIKYELDKASGQLFVDRFLSTPMFYPANYGFIPATLSEDGDPLDILVVAPCPVAPGSVLRCRPLGVMYMTDEAGPDAKIIAVPHDKLSTLYANLRQCSDLSDLLLKQIQHFFENYKTLEPGKWVRMERWGSLDDAREEIRKSVAAYESAHRTGTPPA